MSSFGDLFARLGITEPSDHDLLLGTEHPKAYSEWQESEKSQEIPTELGIEDQRIKLLVHAIRPPSIVDPTLFCRSRLTEDNKLKLDKIDQLAIKNVSLMLHINCFKRTNFFAQALQFLESDSSIVIDWSSYENLVSTLACCP